MGTSATQGQGGQGDPQVPAQAVPADTGNLMATIAAGGDAAVEAYKQLAQSVEDANALREKMGSELPDYVRQYGGDKILELARNFDQVSRHEQMGRLVENFLEKNELPQLVSSEAEEADPLGLEDPEVKALKANLRSMEQRVHQTEALVTREKLDKGFDKVMGELPYTDEEKKQLVQYWGKTVGQWAKTPEGVQRMGTLSEADIRTVTMAAFTDDQKEAIYVRRASQRQEKSKKERSSLATDFGGQHTFPNGSESPTRDSRPVIEKVKELFRENNMDPNGPLFQ